MVRVTSTGHLTVGDVVPDIDLIGHDDQRWNPRRVTSTTVLIFHRHLA